MNEPHLEPLVPQGRLALDIGASIGHWTSLLAGRFQCVHCFDPHPDSIDQLRAEASLHGNVRVFHHAISDRPGTLQLHLYDWSEHSTSHPAEVDWVTNRGPRRGMVLVVADSLDGLGYTQQPVDFIKIDTEGHEHRILVGAEQTISVNHPTLIVEVHHDGDLIQKWLEDHGYIVERIGLSDAPEHHWHLVAT